jgi:hypothetical protein
MCELQPVPEVYGRSLSVALDRNASATVPRPPRDRGPTYRDRAAANNCVTFSFALIFNSKEPLHFDLI